MLNLSTIIKERRKELGWTNEDLAFAAGVSAKTINNIQNGKANPLFDVVEACLNAMGLELQVSENGKQKYY